MGLSRRFHGATSDATDVARPLTRERLRDYRNSTQRAADVSRHAHIEGAAIASSTARATARSAELDLRGNDRWRWKAVLSTARPAQEEVCRKIVTKNVIE